MIAFLHQHQSAIRTIALAEAKVMGAGECMVLDGIFAFLMQGLLFLVTICVLVLKWTLEKERRPFTIFCLDGSKQIIGAGVMHCWNLLCAIYLDELVDYGDQCTWYWLNIVVDCTFGCLVAYGLLQLSMQIWHYDTGQYMVGENRDVLDTTIWFYQVGHWIIVISSMKFVCVAVIFVFGVQLQAVANLFLQHVKDDNHAKLLVVMIITPCVMNTFQFCVTDTFIKWKGDPKKEYEPLTKKEEEEGATA